MDYKSLYQEWTIVRGALKRYRQPFREGKASRLGVDVDKWVALGMLHADIPGPGWPAMVGMTDAGERVRGWRQLADAHQAHVAEMERRRKMIRLFP